MGALCGAWFTPGPPAEIAMPALPDRVGSACNVAITLKFGGFGIALGDVYKPDVVIVPNVVFGSPGGTPFTVQSTAELPLPLTTAVNCCCTPPMFNETEFGVTPTPTAIVTLAAALLVGSACDNAETATVAGLGIVVGAV